MNDEEDMDGIEELQMFEYHAPHLPTQIQDIGTQLFEVNKTIGYQGDLLEEFVMEHYQCSLLAADASIALCMKLSEEDGLPKPSFWDRLRHRPPKSSMVKYD